MSNRADSLVIAILCTACLGAAVVPAAAREGHGHPPASAPPSQADSDATLEFLLRRVAADPHDAIALSKLGAVRLDRARRTSSHEEFDAAAEAFETLLTLRPDSVTARIGLAYAMIGRHRFRDALTHARHAAELRHDDPQTWALLGDAHFALGHYAEAEACYQRLLDQGMTVESLSRMAQIDAVRGRIDKAAQELADAFEAGRLLDAPPAVLAWCRTVLGELYREHGRPEQARTAYREALHYDPGDAVAAWRLAELEAAAGRREEAIRALRPIAESVDRPAVWIAMGDLLSAAGKHDEARAWFDRAEKDLTADLAAGEVGHLRELAEYWLCHGGDAQRAAELALQDLTEVRQDVGAYETAAWALHCAGRHDEARRMMAAALRPGPGTARLQQRARAIRDAAHAASPTPPPPLTPATATNAMATPR